MPNLHRVFIVEDETNTQDLLCLIVADHPNLELVAAAGCLNSARQNLQQHGHHTDIFLVDLGLPDGSGLDFICNIRQQHPDVAIMVLSVFGDEHNVVKAIKHGANGYIHKDQEMGNIANHILSVMQGEAPISPSIAKHILNTLHIKNSPTKTNAASHTLTTRELDVLNILTRGYSRTEVATALHISQHTVTTHIKNIYVKLEVHSRTEAIFEAQQLGIIGNED